MTAGKLRFRMKKKGPWRRQKKEGPRSPSFISRLNAWFNRKKFYTFHKDEMISHKHLPSSAIPDKHEDEWNNESESEKDEFTLEEGDTLDSLKTDKESDSELPTACLGEVASSSNETKGPSLTVVESAVSDPSSKNLHSPPHDKMKRVGNGPVENSLSGSLESLDSLTESYWDPDEDASNATPIVTNIPQPAMDAFFVEHVRFLQVQTQPRKVAEVYDQTRDNNHN